MMRIHGLWILAAAVACASGSPPAAPAARPALPPGAEAISLLGDTLRPPPLGDSLRGEHTRRLEQAVAELGTRPGNADALIWVGRRTAYLGRYRDAIDVFTTGIARHPGDARFLRHRGHRYITVREFDKAVADLALAAQMVRGRPDQVEPDGLPNARNVPTSTLQSNIWYHLGLAYYLQGRFADAVRAYREGLKVARNPDNLVATSHWLYMALRRMGRTRDAEAVLVPIRRDLDVIENGVYHRLLLMYKGVEPMDTSFAARAATDALDDATTGYGIGNWLLYNGRPAEARAVFMRIVRGGNWPAFGYIAAEAELARFAR